MNHAGVRRSCIRRGLLTAPPPRGPRDALLACRPRSCRAPVADPTDPPGRIGTMPSQVSADTPRRAPSRVGGGGARQAGCAAPSPGWRCWATRCVASSSPPSCTTRSAPCSTPARSRAVRGGHRRRRAGRRRRRLWGRCRSPTASTDLNASLVQGAAELLRRTPGVRPVLASCADLPALTGPDLGRLARGRPRRHQRRSSRTLRGSGRRCCVPPRRSGLHPGVRRRVPGGAPSALGMRDLDPRRGPGAAPRRRHPGGPGGAGRPCGVGAGRTHPLGAHHGIASEPERRRARRSRNAAGAGPRGPAPAPSRCGQLFLAVDFFAVDFLAVDFFAVDFFAVDFLAGAFFAALLLDFFAGAFFAASARLLRRRLLRRAAARLLGRAPSSPSSSSRRSTSSPSTSSRSTSWPPRRCSTSSPAPSSPCSWRRSSSRVGSLLGRTPPPSSPRRSQPCRPRSSWRRRRPSWPRRGLRAGQLRQLLRTGDDRLQVGAGGELRHRLLLRPHRCRRCAGCARSARRGPASRTSRSR